MIDREARERIRAFNQERIVGLEARLAQAERALEGLNESCREWQGDGNRCNKPAEFILWGKLLPTEALGPRCYDCAAKHIGHHGLAPNSGYAILDLRPVLAYRTERKEGEDG